MIVKPQELVHHTGLTFLLSQLFLVIMNFCLVNTENSIDSDSHGTYFGYFKLFVARGLVNTDGRKVVDLLMDEGFEANRARYIVLCLI